MIKYIVYDDDERMRGKIYIRGTFIGGRNKIRAMWMEKNNEKKYGGVVVGWLFGSLDDMVVVDGWWVFNLNINWNTYFYSPEL